MAMQTPTQEPTGGRLIPTTTVADTEMRRWVRAHVERVRKLKLHVAMFAVGMLVLTPVWALIEWQDNGGFERWSNNSQPGDWEPWILYVALAWGLFLAIEGLKVHFDRLTTEAEIDREVERLHTGR